MFSHWAWLNTPNEKNGIAGTKYPLAADYTKETARAYGVLDEARGVASAACSSSIPRRAQVRGRDRRQRRPQRRRNDSRAAGAPNRRTVPGRVEARQGAADGLEPNGTTHADATSDARGRYDVAQRRAEDRGAARLAGGRLVLVEVLLYLSRQCGTGHAWRDKFAAAGVEFVSVHQPRSQAELDVALVSEDAIEKMKLTQPVAIDNDHSIVDRFENEFVPAFYVSIGSTSCGTSRPAARGFERIENAIERVLDPGP